jgi:hypothetical protein
VDIIIGLKLVHPVRTGHSDSLLYDDAGFEIVCWRVYMVREGEIILRHMPSLGDIPSRASLVHSTFRLTLRDSVLFLQHDRPKYQNAIQISREQT